MANASIYWYQVCADRQYQYDWEYTATSEKYDSFLGVRVMKIWLGPTIY